MKYLFSLILLVFVAFGISAQNAGVVVQTGLSMGYAKDVNIIQRGAANYGVMFGADARILDGGLQFLVGVQYHAISLQASKAPKFFSNNDWRVVMGRFGIGFSLYQLDNGALLRSKLLASINFNNSAPDGALNIPGYKDLNESFIGLTTGLGITKGAYDIDLEYQYGLLNAYFEKPKTVFDFWTLMVGFNF